jgi:predicted PurR-regulated permease PerM
MIDYFKNKKFAILLIPLVLLIFIAYAMIPFITSLFGTIIIFAIAFPINNWLTKKKKLNKRLAAWIIIVASLIIIILPLTLIIQGLITEISRLPSQVSKIPILEAKLNESLPFQFSINERIIKNELIPFLTQSLSTLASNAISLFAGLFLMYLLLYYLLINSDEVIRFLKEKMPYSEKNSLILIKRFKEITYATIIGTFFIGIIQGGLLAISFYIAGIPNALFWGLVAAVLSFIPIIGPPLIWVPASIIIFLLGSTGKAIIILIFGIILSNIDNILRPILNEKFGKIHPVVSIIGLFVGISQFGFVGIFVGPLIVAYSLILWKIYKEEK